MHLSRKHHTLAMHSIGASIDPSSLLGPLARVAQAYTDELNAFLAPQRVMLPCLQVLVHPASTHRAQSGTSLDSGFLLGLLACSTQAYADTDAATGMWMGARLQLAAVEEAISDQPGPLLESLLEEVRGGG